MSRATGSVLVALALVVSACGGDDEVTSGPAATTVTSVSPTSGTSPTTGAGTTTSPEPTPFAGDMPTDPSRDSFDLPRDPAAGHPLLPDATTFEYQPGLYLYLFEPERCDGPGITIVTSNAQLAEGFARRGITVALAEVRTPGKSGLQLTADMIRAFHYAVHDLSVAVRWLHANATSHCVDPDAIAATGYSFSAIAALSLAYSFEELETGDVVALQGLGEAPVEDLAPLPVPRDLADYSTQVDAVVSFSGFGLASTIERGEPPALLFNGRNDPTVPFSLAEQTCLAASAVNVTCELVAHNAGHGIADDLDAALDRAVTFLRQQLLDRRPS